MRDGNLILNVARQSGQRQFGSMQIFELSPDHHLVALGHAANATAGSDKKWLLGDYTESRFADDSVQAKPPGSESWNRMSLRDSWVSPHRIREQLTSRALWQLIQYYRNNSLDPSQYLFAFWSRIARTVAIGFSVLLAIPFVLGSLRSSGAGTRTMMGLLLGICFFLSRS